MYTAERKERETMLDFSLYFYMFIFLLCFSRFLISLALRVLLSCVFVSVLFVCFVMIVLCFFIFNVFVHCFQVLLISLAISVLSRCLQTSSIRKLFGSEDEGPRRLVEVMLALSASSAAAVSSSAPSTPSKKGKGSGGKGLSATTSLGSPSEGVGSPRKLAKIPLPPHAVSLLLFALCRLPKQRERVANAGGMELAAKVSQ